MKPISPNLFEYTYSLLVTVSSPAQVQRALSIRFDSASWFVAQSLTASTISFGGSTYAAPVVGGTIPRVHRFRTLFYTQAGDQYMSEALEDEILFGSAKFPNEIPEFALAPSSTLFFDVTDMSGPNPTVPYTVQLGITGYRHFDLARPPLVGMVDGQGQRLARRDQPYWYAASGTIGTLSQILLPIYVTEGSKFLARRYDAWSTAEFSAIFSDTGSKQDWQSAAIVKSCLFGNAERPAPLRQPRLIEGNTTLQGKLVDLSGGSNSVQVSLLGTKRVG